MPDTPEQAEKSLRRNAEHRTLYKCNECENQFTLENGDTEECSDCGSMDVENVWV